MQQVEGIRLGLIQPSLLLLKNQSSNLDTGVLETISQQYESLDYFTNYSSLLLDEIRQRGYKFVIKKDVQRWIIMLSIGIITALIGCSINITIEIFADMKYQLLRYWTDHCVQGGDVTNDTLNGHNRLGSKATTDIFSVK